MFLHIGNDIMIPKKDIIAICDMDNVTSTKDGAEFFNRIEDDKIIDDMSGLLPKAFIIVSDKYNGFKIFTSSLNTSTLKKRLEIRTY